MKNFRTILAAACLIAASVAADAQIDTARINHQALQYADSLVQTDRFGNWGQYADLAPASVVKYYGGKEGFIQHIQVGRLRTTSAIEEDAPTLQMLQIRSRNEQWQGVIRLSRYFHKDDTKFQFTTFLICQSKDDGQTWRLFDVSYNSVANVIYMFPEIFDDLAINQPVIQNAVSK